MNEKDAAKLSERKTVHEWLNAANIPQEEAGRPLCLLRRLRIACDALPSFLDTEEAQAVAAFLNIRRGISAAGSLTPPKP